MNITYILGNGFDLAQGFDTSYASFYNYLNMNKDKYKLIEDIIDSINSFRNNIGDINWSDFEEGLLIYISKTCDKISLDDYKRKLNMCIKSLSDFLTEIEEKVSLYKSYSDYNDIINPYFSCAEEHEKIIVRNKTNDETNINVISLNYTSICDRYFKYRGIEVIHLHGKLGTSPIVMGADNQKQMEMYKITKDFIEFLSKYMCKNQIVKSFLSESNNDFMDSLSETDLFVIYGVSFGKTDSTLWKKIGEAISSNNSYAIVGSYSDYVNPSNTIDYIDFITEKKKKICEILSIDYSTYSQNIFIENAKKLLEKGLFLE